MLRTQCGSFLPFIRGMSLTLYTTKYVPRQICSLNKSLTFVNKPSLFTTMDIVQTALDSCYQLVILWLSPSPILSKLVIWLSTLLNSAPSGHWLFWLLTSWVTTSSGQPMQRRTTSGMEKILRVSPSFVSLFPSISDGEYRFNIYAYQTRNKAAYIGMVGTLTSSELLVRQHCIIY
jgi:hypothetical protein